MWLSNGHEHRLRDGKKDNLRIFTLQKKVLRQLLFLENVSVTKINILKSKLSKNIN